MRCAMPSGGKRAGAGRKRILTDCQEGWIGARCAELWEAELEKARAKAFEALAPAYLEEVAKAQSVPIDQRAQWLRSQAFEYHQDDIDSAIREDQGITDEEVEASRFVRIIPKRPYGRRAAIIAQVAAEASARYGTPIKASFVADAWKQFISDYRNLAGK